MHRIEKIKPNFDVSLIVKMSKYSFHQYIGGIVEYFQIALVDLICVFYFLPTQMAFLAVSKSLSDVGTKMIPNAFNILLISRISKLEDIYTINMLSAHAFRIILVILLITWLFICFFTKSIVFLMYGTKYYPMIQILRIFFLGFVLGRSCMVFVSYFSGIGRPDLSAKISIFSLITQVFFVFVFIYYELSLNSMAFAFLISSVILFIFQTVLFIRLSSLPIKMLIPNYEDFITIYRFIIKKIVLTKTFLKNTMLVGK
ncbi:MAG: oligosaccharide flippase family protein [Coxiellaceae bacterium]|nr:oligosaccharide flippase family protein [Coxiellaceae bacterium]